MRSATHIATPAEGPPANVATEYKGSIRGIGCVQYASRMIQSGNLTRASVIERLRASVRFCVMGV